MIVKCPTFLPAFIVADDARLAAQISCVLAKRLRYLPVVDGPRLARPDRESEVIRRTNAAARIEPSLIVFAGLSDDSCNALTRRLPSNRIKRVATASDIDRLPRDRRPLKPSPLVWGNDRIGIGLLTALRSQTGIVFGDRSSCVQHLPSKSGHLVVCEDGDELAQVVAANYAFSLDAGLCVIPEVAEPESDQILEDFYSLYQEQGASPTEALEALKRHLRNRCGSVPVPVGGSITFITGSLPYGFAFSEVPSTHLFKYPDIGISVINGFAAEQPGTRGVNVAVLVDPETTYAPEVEAAAKLLPAKGVFVRGYSGPGANVRSITDMIELFPYDLLIISTHCGDASGYRWTYVFTDSEGIERNLVVDIAIGLAHTDEEDLLKVEQFTRFISLDGVDWHDPNKDEKIYVGSAIKDFIARTVSRKDLEPVQKEAIARVVGSSALKMFDHNYIAVPRSLAGGGTPIVINNACVSWHRLAETFTFSNARSYIGTLFDVTTSEAHEVAVRLLDKRFGKSLPVALCSAQHEVYGDSVRRPYVMMGVYPQRLRVTREDVPRHILQRLTDARAQWQAYFSKAKPDGDFKSKAIAENIDFHDRELASFQRWLAS